MWKALTNILSLSPNKGENGRVLPDSTLQCDLVTGYCCLGGFSDSSKTCTLYLFSSLLGFSPAASRGS